jgi:hypothetical protein
MPSSILSPLNVMTRTRDCLDQGTNQGWKRWSWNLWRRWTER